MESKPERLTLISLNIERDRHLESRVIPFLRERQPDVICLQEVFGVDFKRLVDVLGMRGSHVPMMRQPTARAERCGKWFESGLGVLSRPPNSRMRIEPYFGRPAEPVRMLRGEEKDGVWIWDQAAVKKMLLWTRVQKENTAFTIATTHFTWSAEGKADENQRRDSVQLLKVLSGFEDVVLCGDMNAPRGGEIFSRFVAQYRDHIPPKYTTSIDGELHRAGQLNIMVDGLFSTPRYEISDVELVSGLSDHCAITATVCRNVE